MSEPKTIMRRMCPKCQRQDSWSVYGFAYPGGDSSRWKCIACGYRGSPEITKYKMALEKIE